MDLRLGGKRALVTGSSGGVGAVIARTLSREGCEVIVHGRDAARLAAFADALRATDGVVHEVIADLADANGVESACEQALATGTVDIIVANAGPFCEHTATGATDEEWNTALQENLMSAVRCVRHLVPGMRAAGWGRIITIGSRAVATPLVNMAEYGAAKAALVNYTAGLARELSGTGITANTVSPGVILTDGLRTMFTRRPAGQCGTRVWDDALEAEVTRDYAPNPTGRLGRPEDVAAAVAYLASPLADYVNASVLRVDGGITPSVNP